MITAGTKCERFAGPSRRGVEMARPADPATLCGINFRREMFTDGFEAPAFERAARSSTI
jgi:hypothetical protein